ncbi:MAG TPA: YhfC family glutamic-type intramembrane protease [Sandaracinaceae bacterium LLY-WYZ-13_1]|nr:YhfC family glutamic-type intramembrane protease [Sandaracinaceae bacterium LLY-WYZ-13_1]
MGGLAISYAVEALLVSGAVVALAVWLRRRTRVGYGLFVGGALVFVASQLVHLPLNLALAPVLPASRWATAAILGLSAGLCEELARYLAIRFVFRRVRHGGEALMLGAGHGGIEALLVAALAAVTFVNLVALDARGPGAWMEDLSAEQRAQVSAGLAQLRDASPWLPLVAALERWMVLPVHLAATLMVTRAVGTRRPGWLLAAIAFHAALDAGAVAFAGQLLAAELWIGSGGAVGLGVILALGRRMRAPRRDAVEAEPSGAPVELARATKVYGRTVRALRGVSLTLAPGSRTCLLGPNGAGKTTAIRLLTGGLAPTDGHAFLFGQRGTDPGFLDAKRRLGVVPQLPGMYDDLSVRAWLEVVRDLYRRGDPDAVAEALALGPLLDRPMAELSGGQKRRVAIAAAVLGEPELLILDEPSAGLDPIASREVVDYLARLDASQTILLCTHDLEEAEALCDRVVVMRDGEVLVHESIEALRGRMAPRLALRVAGDPDAARDRLEALGHPIEVDGDGALRVSVVDPEIDAPALLRGLLESGVDVVECAVERPSLEALFLDIVGRGREANDDREEVAPVEDPLPPPVPLRELFGAPTRRLIAKEWRQLRASGGAFWTSLMLPVFLTLVVPQALIFALRGGGQAPSGEDLPDFGVLAEIGDDPTRAVLAFAPLFVTIAALVAPTALITHAIVHERETRTFELLIALPVRIQQVVAAKVACAFLFSLAVCGGALLVLGVELVALGMATVPEVLALFALLGAVLAQATASALLVAVVAKDFRTANNLAGVVIAPTVVVVMLASAAVTGGAARALILTLLFVVAALAIGRAALRSTTFEKLLA